ncbi:16S rRNA (uracil1498-N3)-methyltransferase [Nitrosospira sp. Nl5]|uniref:16S rRNA (uracil(1498)-N(3))-methyltransferase n=1 Tax=Nitrosospira sp. Nl5 TaxID=200120 RepID=UPI00088F749C|nr:16S rRNA (uracil(1498)-N(3))-methyltransferase [Nitrosospira sp. Nl5]SCY77161.1 16S rRNA (uracil1498-N3)-methyltransferase [Nitrosospira sp. Nl5]
MALPRFYCPEKMTVGQVIELPANVAHHALRALRLEQDDELILFNGDGGEFRAAIVRIGKHGAAVMIERYLDIERESPLVITLAQAICTNEKMDWIVQKGVEMGISRIQPLVTKLSMVRLSAERAERRMKHWQQIVISACEQCGRNRIPRILPLISLPGWLGPQIGTCQDLNNSIPRNPCFILSPTAKKGLRDFPGSPPVTALTLLVGPEGGFTPEEEAAAAVAGFIPLCLGKRILRTESAALAAASAMQALWGDY